MTNALAETLEMLGQAAKDAADDWWLIGSAAVVLHGGQVPRVKDVDVMMSARDADAFLRRVGAERGGAEPSGRFQSRVFGIWKTPPVCVEVFGGFSIATDGKWREVGFSTREPVKVGDATVYVPSAVDWSGCCTRSVGQRTWNERKCFGFSGCYPPMAAIRAPRGLLSANARKTFSLRSRYKCSTATNVARRVCRQGDMRMLSKLPPRERQIVDMLYERGAMAVADICDALPVQLSGSAVRAMLKRLEDKGFVQRSESERGFLYSPVVSETAAKKSALSEIVRVFFNGSPASAASALLGMSDKLKDDELSQLEQMIAKARKAKGGQ